jgi:hypothetical protein
MDDDSRRSVAELEARLAELSHLAHEARVQGVEPPEALEREAQAIQRMLDAKRRVQKEMSTDTVAFVLESAAVPHPSRDGIAFDIVVGREYVIGRDPKCDIHFADHINPLSRRHARLYWEGNQHLFIEDLESVLGVIVNGERIRSRRLRDGDRIILGGRTLVLRAIAMI